MESVIVTDMETCVECGRRAEHIHHCIHGTANRKLADKYKLVVPMCHICHSMLHDREPDMDLHYQQMAERAFNKAYPNLNFREIFGQSYLGKEHKQINLFGGLRNE